MIIFVFLIFLAFWPFPWQWRPFWKFRKYSPHLLIVLNIPVKFYWFPFSSRWEMCQTHFWRKKERKKKNFYLDFWHYVSTLDVSLLHNYVPQTKFGETYCVCSVSYYYSSFFFLSSAKSVSDTFLSDYWTEINKTSQEC
jgi:hypothetical protein